MRLFMLSAILLIGVALSSDDKEFEIKLKEKLKYLKRCVSKHGQLEHDTRFDILFINVKQQLCLDMLRNSAQDFLFNEAPTHFDIFVPAQNNVTQKCNANFTLTAVSKHVTSLKAVCVKTIPLKNLTSI